MDKFDFKARKKAMFGPKRIPTPGNSDVNMTREEPLVPGAAEKPSNLKPKRAGQRIFGRKAAPGRDDDRTIPAKKGY
jgi:hypothetical protein